MTKKIAVSLPDKTLARAKAAVKHGKAPSVSNYIASLIDKEGAAESFEQMIADGLRASGATDTEIRSAERRAREDFERAGLVPRTRHREDTPRKTG